MKILIELRDKKSNLGVCQFLICIDKLSIEKIKTKYVKIARLAERNEEEVAFFYDDCYINNQIPFHIIKEQVLEKVCKKIIIEFVTKEEWKLEDFLKIQKNKNKKYKIPSDYKIYKIPSDYLFDYKIQKYYYLQYI